MSSVTQAAGAQVVAFDALQYRLAGAAFLQFGMGRHPAALNFGNCISYELAKATGEALLYKGKDFSQTDIESAL